MPKLDEYLRISEAAEYVGVAPNTLRNWGAAQKVTEYRHPLNNYRLFRRDELMKLREKLISPRPKVANNRPPR